MLVLKALSKNRLGLSQNIMLISNDDLSSCLYYLTSLEGLDLNSSFLSYATLSETLSSLKYLFLVKTN